MPEEKFPKLIRPGVSVTFKPIKIGEKFYDSEYPPKILIGKNGEELTEGGKEITQDEAYSIMFWQNKKDTIAKGLHESMMLQISKAVKEGKIYQFVAGKRTTQGFEIEQTDKEKLSALRILAKEMGYQIGNFKLNENSGTVEGIITKIN